MVMVARIRDSYPTAHLTCLAIQPDGRARAYALVACRVSAVRIHPCCSPASLARVLRALPRMPRRDSPQSARSTLDKTISLPTPPSPLSHPLVSRTP